MLGVTAYIATTTGYIEESFIAPSPKGRWNAMIRSTVPGSIRGTRDQASYLSRLWDGPTLTRASPGLAHQDFSIFRHATARVRGS